MKNAIKIFITLCFINLSFAEEQWGRLNYKSLSISDQLQENDRILRVVHKVQCKYFSNQKENILTDMRSALFLLHDNQNNIKINQVSSTIKTLINTYCSGGEKMNPESMAGFVLTKCMSECRDQFKSSLEFIGKQGTENTRYCESACHEFVSPFKEFSRVVIEANNVLKNTAIDSHDCEGSVDNSHRGAKTKIPDSKFDNNHGPKSSLQK